MTPPDRRRPARRNHPARTRELAGGDAAGAGGPGPLTAHPEALESSSGELLTVPTTAHTLTAIEDSALLLTVSLVLGTPGTVAAATTPGPVYSWQENWD